MKKLLLVAVVGCLFAGLILMVSAVAQEVPSAEALVEKMVVSFESDEPAFTRIHRVVTVAGRLDERTWDVWSRDKSTYRAQRHDETLLVRTEDQIGTYVPAPGSVALVIPKETIGEAGDDLPE